MLDRARAALREWRLAGRIAARLPEPTPELIAATGARSLDYARACQLPGSPFGRHTYAPGASAPLLYATCFAVLLRHLLGEVDTWRKCDRDELAAWINGFQADDGLFRDPLVAQPSAETEDWWGWRHLTLLSFMALHALGGRPRRSFAFLAPLADPSAAGRWLDGLDWSARVAFTSNAVQNRVAAMQFARDFMGDHAYDETIPTLIDLIAARCDAHTGLWGADFPDRRSALSEGVQAGYHFWLLFWYERRDIPHPAAAARSLLRLQNRLGGFNRRRAFASACEDIDALDPLVRLSLREQADAREPIRRSLSWILTNFNEGGGAVFRRDEEFVYGHTLMHSSPDESSIFATWFRTLALAVGSRFLHPEGTRFHFLDAPGLQFAP